MQVQFTQSSGSPFIDEASRTQVPLRATMEAYGCEVNWNQETSTAIVIKDDITVEVPIGARYIYRNQVRIENDTAALLKNGRTYLPIRAVLEAFGAIVEWDANTQSVIVYSDGISDTMYVHFIDVGQGDSIFVDYGEYEMLIDAGDNEYGDDVAAYIYPYVDDALEIIVATHAHADHVGGLDDILAVFQVNEVIYSGSTATSVTWNDFYDAAMSEPNCTIITDSDMQIPFGEGATLHMADPGDKFSNENNNSVVIMLEHGEDTIAFTGDLESDAEEKIFGRMGDIDVLKAGHHGSSTASSAEFLSIAQPEFVIVSAGLGNTYGHPHLEAMQRFQAIGATVYGTFKSGTIVMTSTGNGYSFNTNTPITTSDAGASSGSGQSSTTTTSNTVTKNEAVYIGNSNSMKFHELSCRYADDIFLTNIMYFKTREAAINAGYVPCKVCCP